VNPRAATALVLVCALALGTVVLAARGRDRSTPPPPGSKFEGAIIPKGFRAPDIGLPDQDGKTVSMRRFRGRPVIVTFLYTHCHDTCPATAQQIKGALDDLGRDVPAVAVAVDPPRDTPASAKAFLAKQRMLGRLHFALGSKAQLRPVWKGFAIQPQTTTQEHQSRITLVDKRGFQRIGFPGQQATPERLAHDVALLERE
jgi:protein SCO1/2